MSDFEEERAQKFLQRVRYGYALKEAYSKQLAFRNDSTARILVPPGMALRQVITGRKSSNKATRRVTETQDSPHKSE